MEDNKTPKLGTEPMYPCNLRKIGDNEYRIASEKDMREGIYLSSTMGMSQRLYIATQIVKECVANYGTHFDIVSVTKWSYEITDELLRQENL